MAEPLAPTDFGKDIGFGFLAPKGWRAVEVREDGAAVLGPGKLSVIASISDDHGDGKRWVHVSIAHPTRMPLWSEVKWLKEHFTGKDRYAALIFPPERNYVNIHPHCLHLYACLDGWPLPEFSGMIGGLRSI